MSTDPRIVLVTGADANTGYAIVRRFAADGARVYLHAPTFDRAVAAAGRLKAESGLSVHPLGADFRQPAEIEAMFARLEREVKGLDVLVNNAVDLAMGYSFLDSPLSLVQSAVAVNITAVFLCSQLAARLMVPRKSGAIVNLGSMTAQRVTRHRSIYVATKGAIDSLTRATAVELGPLGIRVNCVAPGHIHTSRWDNLPADVAERRRAGIPLGYEATPEDVAETIHFLASPQARSITGTTLLVDGGNTAQLQPPQNDV